MALQYNNVHIRWIGKRGMLWDELSATVSRTLKDFSPPAFLLIHLGANDLGRTKLKVLMEDMEREILRLRLLLPDTKIIWSDLLMRRFWCHAKSGKAMEKARKRVNLAIGGFIKKEGHFVIQHPNIRSSETNLYRFDGVHLSDLGCDVYLNNIQGGLESILSIVGI